VISFDASRLARWIVVNLLLGPMPLAVTYLVHVLTNGKSPLLRIEDLMFVVIMLVGTTFVEEGLDKLEGAIKPFVQGALITLLVLAGFFLAFAVDLPNDSKALNALFLQKAGILLSIWAAVTTFGIQIRICHSTQSV
jgi:hypothetical protein